MSHLPPIALQTYRPSQAETPHTATVEGIDFASFYAAVSTQLCRRPGSSAARRMNSRDRLTANEPKRADASIRRRGGHGHALLCCEAAAGRPVYGRSTAEALDGRRPSSQRAIRPRAEAWTRRVRAKTGISRHRLHRHLMSVNSFSAVVYIGSLLVPAAPAVLSDVSVRAHQTSRSEVVCQPSKPTWRTISLMSLTRNRQTAGQLREPERGSACRRGKGLGDRNAWRSPRPLAGFSSHVRRSGETIRYAIRTTCRSRRDSDEVGSASPTRRTILSPPAGEPHSPFSCRCRPVRRSS